MKKHLPTVFVITASILMLALAGSCRKENANPDKYGLTLSFNNFDFNSFKEVKLYKGDYPINVSDSLSLPLSNDGKLFLNHGLMGKLGNFSIVSKSQGVNERVLVSTYFYSSSSSSRNITENISLIFTYRQIAYTINETNRIVSIAINK